MIWRYAVPFRFPGLVSTTNISVLRTFSFSDYIFAANIYSTLYLFLFPVISCHKYFNSQYFFIVNNCLGCKLNA